MLQTFKKTTEYDVIKTDWKWPKGKGESHRE